MPDAATLTSLVQIFGPLGTIALVVAYGVFRTPPRADTSKVAPIMPPILSKDYERTMAVMMGRIADTLEKQSLILEKIERHIDVMIQTAKK